MFDNRGSLCARLASSESDSASESASASDSESESNSESASESDSWTDSSYYLDILFDKAKRGIGLNQCFDEYAKALLNTSDIVW